MTNLPMTAPTNGHGVGDAPVNASNIRAGIDPPARASNRLLGAAPAHGSRLLGICRRWMKPKGMATCALTAVALYSIASQESAMGRYLPAKTTPAAVPLGGNRSLETRRPSRPAPIGRAGAEEEDSAAGDAPWTPVAESLVPPSLLPAYAPKKLPFEVTRSMLRQSRPVVGNTQRLHSYIRKLRSRNCTTVVFLGGSVTAGHNAGVGAQAFPARWMEWLNARYPCDAADGTRGEHRRINPHSGDSLRAFASWSVISSVEAFDLVFIEFNVNDRFIGSLPHALESKGAEGETTYYYGSWYFEVLLRRLLLLRKPDPVAIVTFNADYTGRNWAFQPYFDPANARKSLFNGNFEPLKIWVSSMYEVPVFSAVIWMLPLAGKRGRDWQFNRTANPYNTAAWHADACCHPLDPGHRLLSLVLAHCLVEEERAMLSLHDMDTAGGQRDFTADARPVLREPLYLSPEEDDMYVKGSFDSFAVDFTDPQKRASWEDGVVAANVGWMWHADNKDKDKHGLIADEVEGGPRVALRLTGGRHGRVEVMYVVSYENFGVALAWLDGSVGNRTGEACGEAAAEDAQRLDAIWSAPASVPKAEILEKRLGEGDEAVLHLCLTPREGNRKGAGNKFKLLGVRTY